MIFYQDSDFGRRGFCICPSSPNEEDHENFQSLFRHTLDSDSLLLSLGPVDFAEGTSKRGEVTSQ